MSMLFIINMILFFSSSIAMNPLTCQLDRVFFDENAIFDKHWHETIPLKGGLSGSDIYKAFDSNGDVYVFRNIRHRSQKEIMREIYAHTIASECGYGPHLYAYNVMTGEIVISLLEHCNTILDQNAQMRNLVDALKTMHNGPALCDQTSIIDQTIALYNSIEAYPEMIDKNKIAILIQHISSLKGLPKTATHRDLHPNNIFFTDTGVKFIDFESAGQDDPFFDIASIIIFYQYSDALEKEFLTLYFGYELSKAEQEHLALMKKTVLLFYGLILLSKLPSVQKPINETILSLQELLDKIASGSLSLEKEENVMHLSLAFLLEAINQR